MKTLGKEPNPYMAGFAQAIGVAETEKEALELYKEPAEYFFDKCLHVDARFAGPPGYVTEATQRAGLESQIGRASQTVNAAAAQRAISKTAREFPAILENGYIICGSPDQVAEQLRELAKELHVGHLMCLLQFGNMGKQLTQYNTRLFAEKVMPQLQDLFKDEWEDRWWPKPLAAADAATPARTTLAAE
jgi:alkanesulfonate monooxygenase SsuD/methylene tetrahydromethanopterin reductase-like flavin-dependent oxidoreductase (luciferase family)